MTPGAVDPPRCGHRPAHRDGATRCCADSARLGGMPSEHAEFPNLRVFDHPLIQAKLTRVRDARTDHAEFRRLLNEIAALMTFTASRDLPVTAVEIATPLERTRGVALARQVALVPILRAGLAMTDGILALMPEAKVGHIGVYRDEKTLRPVSYYAKLPIDIAESETFVVDPMLATGGSASHAVTELRRRGCRSIRLVCLVAAPEGVRRMYTDHPQVPVFAASLDRELDGRGYIRPGLGDAGDRIFGTQ